MPANQRPPTADRLTLLAEGAVEVEGRLPWSSNGTFLVTCRLEDQQDGAVYKPQAGERPLWDFPHGLYRREVAAYELSELLGWDLVPETVVREDAPLGPGSLQRFVPADFSHHYFTLVDDPAHQEQLMTICAFDVVTNNADRKSGHCLLGDDGRIWAIDHGLCFHPEPKLRTVIWGFAGQCLPGGLIDGLASLAEGPPTSLAALLEPDELAALSRRAGRLADAGRFPQPRGDHFHYPWPPV